MWGHPCGCPHRTTSLLLDPPLFDVVDRAVRRWIEVLQGLLRDGERVVRISEVVWLVLVEDLVEGLVLLLPRCRGAVAVRRVASFLDRLVHRRVLEAGEAEAFDLLGRVRYVAGVPDRVGVHVAAEAPADDRR